MGFIKIHTYQTKKEWYGYSSDDSDEDSSSIVGTTSISVCGYKREIDALTGVDDVVIHTDTSRELILGYPTEYNRVKVIKPNTPEGFTLRYIIEKIYENYEAMYRIDEINGSYGIWGHTMSELCIEGIEYDSKTICPYIGS